MQNLEKTKFHVLRVLQAKALIYQFLAVYVDNGDNKMETHSRKRRSETN